ncbi:MAG: hypothetical protein CMK00_04140 [Planctomycetes bacterium]|jgi:hypothetical protein|nr:hypothetical protein [Planctomycetota bacterium]HJO25861.1 hypothetical protein [Planctomycetota bacterium]
MTENDTNSPSRERQEGSGLLLGAAACAALPTVCGLILFAVLRESRSSELVTPGFWILGIGALLSVVGATCLATHARQGRVGAASGSGRGRASLIALWLVANYPLAAFLTYESIGLLSAVVINIENQSGGGLDFFRLSGAGIHMEEAPFPADARITVELHPRRDGQLTYALRLPDGALREGTAVGYVTPGFGFQTTLAIAPDGAVTGGN